MAMLNYIALLIMLLLTALITIILSQNTKAVTNRLVAAYLIVSLLSLVSGLIRLTTTDQALALFMSKPIGMWVALSTTFFSLLILALFFPQHYAQPIQRWLLSLPYLIASAYVLFDMLQPMPSWLIRLDPASDGTWLLISNQAFTPLLASLILAQFIQIIMLAAIAIRNPHQRAAAITLCLGLIFSIVISSSVQARTLPIAYSVSPLPIYLALIWITLRYQIFRPTIIALEAAIEHIDDGVLLLDTQRQVRYANQTARTLLGLEQESSPALLATLLERNNITAIEQTDTHGTEVRHLQLAQHQATASYYQATETQVIGDPIARSVLVLRNVSESEQQAIALRNQNAEQQRLLDLVATLETPAIALADGVLLAPIVGTLDSRRIEVLTGRLLREASERRARRIILDIAGVTVLDTAVAKALLQLAQALRLLGCKVTITSISAEVAMTLTNLEISFAEVSTARSPQEALELLRAEML
jgi:anti-anti-sigma regulatory factor